MEIRGYKVFNPDWTCREFQYEVGKSYEMDEKPVACERGFHFCGRLIDCFDYYKFDPKNKVAEVIAYGDIVTRENKSCTNKIKIFRELSWDKVLDMVNTGNSNEGICNTGNRNKGDCNTGDINKGNRNSGDCNIGFFNTGNRNKGDYNTGDCNIGFFNTGSDNKGNGNSGNYNKGNWNSGSHNKGNFNVGDYNNTDCSLGFFNTKKMPVYMFNQPTNLTFKELRRTVLYTMKCIKAAVRDNSEELTEEEKEIILSLPNFDPDIFKQITGIDLRNNE